MTQPATNAPDPLTTLQALVGAEHVRAAAPGDAIDGMMPRWVVEAGTSAELAKVLSFANGAGLHVIARGGGTKIDWGNAPRGLDLALSTRRLDRILEHADGDMTATVQAGCRVADFAQLLAQRGQRLALDALWPNSATIGGIIATNDNGALRPTFGSLRDHLIGVTIALADGTLARSGGKVVKNVAGYDLPKLVIGSFGTLGVITEATFRLYPLAHQTRTLQFACASLDVVARMPGAMARCSPVTTAVQIEMGTDGPTTFLVMVEGLPDAIEGKIRRVTRAAVDCGARQGDPPADAWQAREKLFAPLDSSVGRFSLLPTQWPECSDALRKVAASRGVNWQVVAQAYGVGHVSLSGAVAAEIVETLKALRGQLEQFGGTMVVLRCPAEIKKQFNVWPEAGDSLALMRRVKEQFDPKGTLSPGRFVGGI